MEVKGSGTREMIRRFRITSRAQWIAPGTQPRSSAVSKEKNSILKSISGIKGYPIAFLLTSDVTVSIIDGIAGNPLQLVIPSKLLNSNGGGLKIEAICKEKNTDIPDVAVNYDSWANVKGWKTNPIPPATM